MTREVNVEQCGSVMVGDGGGACDNDGGGVDYGGGAVGQ